MANPLLEDASANISTLPSTLPDQTKGLNS
jgi:hypothetical protein